MKNISHVTEFLAFVVILNKDITTEDDNNLLSLENSLKNDLSKFSQINEFEAKIEGDKVISSTTKKSGALLQSIDSIDGKPIWTLNVSKNQIIAQCLSYDDWKAVCSKAIRFINIAIKVLENDKAVTSLSFQRVDKFVQDKISDNYSQFDILAQDNPYLTPHSHKSGKLWHVHQGWFNYNNDNSKVLNVLNIGTSEKDNDLNTAINHVSQYFFKDSVSLSNNSQFDKIFEELYGNNKNVLASLLNKEQLKTIKVD